MSVWTDAVVKLHGDSDAVHMLMYNRLNLLCSIILLNSDAFHYLLRRCFCLDGHSWIKTLISVLCVV